MAVLCVWCVFSISINQSVNQSACLFFPVSSFLIGQSSFSISFLFCFINQPTKERIIIMAMAMRGLGGGPWDKLMERFKDQKRAELR